MNYLKRNQDQGLVNMSSLALIQGYFGSSQSKKHEIEPESSEILTEGTTLIKQSSIIPTSKVTG